MNACYLIFQSTMLMPIPKIEDHNVFFHIELLSLMKADNFIPTVEFITWFSNGRDLKNLDAFEVVS